MAYIIDLLLNYFNVPATQFLLDNHSNILVQRRRIKWNEILPKMINQAEGDDEYNCIQILTNFDHTDHHFHSTMLTVLPQIGVERLVKSKVSQYLISRLSKNDRRIIPVEVFNANYINRARSVTA